MFKRVFRRSALFLVRAGLVLAVICLGAEPGYTAIFSQNQTWDVSASGWSVVCSQNWNTGVWSCADWDYGSYTVGYTLPFGAWKSFYIYDDTRGRWDEAVHMLDEDL